MMIKKKVMDNAYGNGVVKVITSGCDKKSNQEVLELVNDDSGVYGSLGFHPSSLGLIEEDMKWLEDNIMAKKVIAVGEIGLDYHEGDDDHDLQKEYFRRQIELAIKYYKPVIVHSRDAIGDTYEILKDYNKQVRGVIHCYSGSVEMAKKFIDLGMFLGVGGVVTFPNAKSLIQVIENVSLEYILLETDSPFLTPVPLRGKKNEPKNVRIVAEKIALLLGISWEEVALVTTSNASRLFDFDN